MRYAVHTVHPARAWPSPEMHNVAEDALAKRILQSVVAALEHVILAHVALDEQEDRE